MWSNERSYTPFVCVHPIIFLKLFTRTQQKERIAYGYRTFTAREKDRRDRFPSSFPNVRGHSFDIFLSPTAVRALILVDSFDSNRFWGEFSSSIWTKVGERFFWCVDNFFLCYKSKQGLSHHDSSGIVDYVNNYRAIFIDGDGDRDQSD